MDRRRNWLLLIATSALTFLGCGWCATFALAQAGVEYYAGSPDALPTPPPPLTDGVQIASQPKTSRQSERPDIDALWDRLEQAEAEL